VLGSAAVAALIQARLSAELPGAASSNQEFSGTLPPVLHDGFSAAMSQSLLLPAALALVCAVIVLFFAKPNQTVAWDVGASGTTPRTGSVPQVGATKP